MLFKNENPVLGPLTTETEVALTSTSSSTTATSAFKPTTRETISFPITAVAGASSSWVFQAPWQCQVMAVRVNCTVHSTGASALSLVKIATDTVAPAAANGTTIINLLSSTIAQGTIVANTRQNVALSATSGATTLNAGDQIAYFSAADNSGLLGAYLQIEIQQLG